MSTAGRLMSRSELYGSLLSACDGFELQPNTRRVSEVLLEAAEDTCVALSLVRPTFDRWAQICAATEVAMVSVPSAVRSHTL